VYSGLPIGETKRFLPKDSDVRPSSGEGGCASSAGFGPHISTVFARRSTDAPWFGIGAARGGSQLHFRGVVRDQFG
jgi:hypothetical protein